MKRVLGCQIRRGFQVVNKFTQSDADRASRLSLFTSNSFNQLLSKDLPLESSEHVRSIIADPGANPVYRYMVPFNLFAKLSWFSLYLVTSAVYQPEVRSLKFKVLDSSGVFDHYISVDEICPITYQDLLELIRFTTPFNEIIDTDLIYKHTKTNTVFVFEKNGNWNAEVANHPDLDFTALFNETEWLDDQIDKK